jgi:hypothetical protein
MQTRAIELRTPVVVCVDGWGGLDTVAIAFALAFVSGVKEYVCDEWTLNTTVGLHAVGVWWGDCMRACTKTSTWHCTGTHMQPTQQFTHVCSHLDPPSTAV